MYPILEANPGATIYAVDFSKNAIDLLQQHENYDASRVHAHVLDIVKDSLTSIAQPGSLDFCTAIFALSAISPGMLMKVGKNVLWQPFPSPPLPLGAYSLFSTGECLSYTIFSNL